MCDIFPVVQNCCVVISLRVAMLIISVFAIMTGSLLLSIIEQHTNASYGVFKNATEIRDVDQALKASNTFVPNGFTCMSVIFIIGGASLLFATLSDQEGFVQAFVWLTFFNVILGFIMVLFVSYQCLFKPVCSLSNLDWLTGSITLVLSTVALFFWLYFISVANSYVVQIFS